MANAMVNGSSPVPEGATKPSKKDEQPSLFNPGSHARDKHDKKDTGHKGGNNSKDKHDKPPVRTQKDITNESLAILRQMNQNMIKQGAEIKSIAESQKSLTECQKILTEKVDNLYNEDEYEEDFYGYDENYPFDEFDDSNENVAPSDGACGTGDDLLPLLDFDSSSNPKRPRLEEKTGESCFEGLDKKYHIKEKTSDRVDANLATFVDKSFLLGVSQEVVNGITNDLHRPENCHSLTKTRVNPGIWKLLKNHTQVNDNQMQGIQTLIVQTGMLIVQYLQTQAPAEKKLVELGSNAIALLGQANHLINNNRKEAHRPDLDSRYSGLTSPNLPYTEWLYGDEQDINKNIKDIQDMSKLGRVMRGGYSNTGSYGYGRGRGRGFRGYRGFRGRGRGLRFGRGRGRGSFHAGPLRQYDDREYLNSKNSTKVQRK